MTGGAPAKSRKRKKRKGHNLTDRLVGPPDDKQVLYRWNPGPWLRKKGFKAVDLWADGPAFTLEDCKARGFSDIVPLRHKGRTPLAPSAAIALAKDLNAVAGDDVADRKTDADAAPTPRIVRRLKTFAELRKDYLASDEFKALSAKTRASYAHHLDQISRVFGPEPPAAITAEIIGQWWRAERDRRGESAAHKDAATLKTILNWAQKRERWTGLIPHREAYSNMGFAKPKPRLRVGLAEELDALLVAFDDPADRKSVV